MLRDALAVLRARRLAVIGLAVLVMVPAGTLDRLLLAWSDRLERDHETALALLVSLVSTSIFMFGSVLYAGILEHLVAEQRGHGAHSLLVALRDVRYGRLLLADLAVATLILLGLVLLVVPGIAAMTLTALVGALMGIEALGVWAAIRRSASLVVRRFWLVFLLVTVPLVLQVIVGGILDELADRHPLLWVLGSVLVPLGMVVYVGLVSVTLAFELTSRRPAPRPS